MFGKWIRDLFGKAAELFTPRSVREERLRAAEAEGRRRAREWDKPRETTAPPQPKSGRPPVIYERIAVPTAGTTQRDDDETYLMRIVSTEGIVEREVRGSRARSRVAAHHDVVERFISARGGDVSTLRPFRGERIGGVELETDPERLVALAQSAELAFLEIYVI